MLDAGRISDGLTAAGVRRLTPGAIAGAGGRSGSGAAVTAGAGRRSGSGAAVTAGARGRSGSGASVTTCARRN